MSNTTSVSFNYGGRAFYLVPDNMEKSISKYYVGCDDKVYLCPECFLNRVSDNGKLHDCVSKRAPGIDVKSKKLPDFVKAWTLYRALYTDCTFDSVKFVVVDIYDTQFRMNSYYENMTDGEIKLCDQCQILYAADCYGMGPFEFVGDDLLHNCHNSWKADNLDKIIAASNQPNITEQIAGLCRYGFVDKKK